MSNILEDFIYITHRAGEYIAMMRANALIDLRIARPLRWLAGKSSELIGDWSPISMGLVFEKLEKLFERAVQDPKVLFESDLKLFDDVAASQPAFREFLDHMYKEETVLSPNGKKKHLVYEHAPQLIVTYVMCMM